MNKKKIQKINITTMFYIDLKNCLIYKPFMISDIIFDEKNDRYFFIFSNKKDKTIQYIYKAKKIDFENKFVKNVTFISNTLNKEFTKNDIENIVDEIFAKDNKIYAKSVKFNRNKLLAFRNEINKNGKRFQSTKLFLTLNVPNQNISNEKVDFLSLMIYIINYYIQ